MQTIERELNVLNKLGLHARSAATIVKELSKFDSQVVLTKDGKNADGKSILSIITLDCPMGSRLKARITGGDAEEAMEALSKLFANKFGED